MDLVLLGPPGSGKGTLARWLCDRLHLAHFEMGSELRRVAKEDSEVGRALRQRLAGGNMADTDLVMRILAERVATLPGDKRGWLFDGVPRKADQAKGFLELAREEKVCPQGAIVLGAHADVLIRRLQGRATCEKCGEIYNVETRPSPSPRRCLEACGGALKTREDDTPEGIRRRLELYRNETEPAIEVLHSHGFRIARVEASRSIEEVRSEVQKVLQTWREMERSEPVLNRNPCRGSR